MMIISMLFGVCRRNPRVYLHVLYSIIHACLRILLAVGEEAALNQETVISTPIRLPRLPIP